MRKGVPEHTRRSCRHPVCRGQCFSATLEVGGFWGTSESPCRGMDIHIAHNPQGASCRIRQMNGEMPAERCRIEGGLRHIERHPDLTMEPSVDEGNGVFFRGGGELWKGRECMGCNSFRHSPLDPLHERPKVVDSLPGYTSGMAGCRPNLAPQAKLSRRLSCSTDGTIRPL